MQDYTLWFKNCDKYNIRNISITNKNDPLRACVLRRMPTEHFEWGTKMGLPGLSDNAQLCRQIASSKLSP